MVGGTWKSHGLFLSVALSATAACGCSGLSVAEVEGVVKLDGNPLPQVRVQFMPDPDKQTLGPVSAGVTDEQGRYKLLCADKRSGAAVGWHKVVITDPTVRLGRPVRTGRRDDDEQVARVQQGPHK